MNHSREGRRWKVLLRLTSYLQKGGDGRCDLEISAVDKQQVKVPTGPLPSCDSLAPTDNQLPDQHHYRRDAVISSLFRFSYRGGEERRLIHLERNLIIELTVSTVNVPTSYSAFSDGQVWCCEDNDPLGAVLTL